MNYKLLLSCLFLSSMLPWSISIHATTPTYTKPTNPRTVKRPEKITETVKDSVQIEISTAAKNAKNMNDITITAPSSGKGYTATNTGTGTGSAGEFSINKATDKVVSSGTSSGKGTGTDTHTGSMRTVTISGTLGSSPSTTSGTRTATTQYTTLSDGTTTQGGTLTRTSSLNEGKKGELPGLSSTTTFDGNDNSIINSTIIRSADIDLQDGEFTSNTTNSLKGTTRTTTATKDGFSTDTYTGTSTDQTNYRKVTATKGATKGTGSYSESTSKGSGTMDSTTRTVTAGTADTTGSNYTSSTSYRGYTRGVTGTKATATTPGTYSSNGTYLDRTVAATTGTATTPGSYSATTTTKNAPIDTVSRTVTAGSADTGTETGYNATTIGAHGNELTVNYQPTSGATWSKGEIKNSTGLSGSGTAYYDGTQITEASLGVDPKSTISTAIGRTNPTSSVAVSSDATTETTPAT